MNFRLFFRYLTWLPCKYLSLFFSLFLFLCLSFPAPPAFCTSITSPATFCVNHGANGLAYGAATLSCRDITCDVLADASTCCAPAGNSATCASISDVTSFCLNNGNNNLVDNPEKVQCATSTCLITSGDAIKCCKPAPPAMCSSITDPSIFCVDFGNNGLVEYPEKEQCTSSMCFISTDASHCCKPAVSFHGTRSVYTR